jgi:hypothetical protein
LIKSKLIVDKTGSIKEKEKKKEKKEPEIVPDWKK